MTQKGPLILGADPWHAEFAHVRAASQRDDGQEENVSRKKPEEPSFGVGSQVVFKDSDPAGRRPWTVVALDQPPFPGYLALTSLRYWAETDPTCTIRRGSLVKTSISMARLEPAP
jgi:hypothetical protein